MGNLARPRIQLLHETKLCADVFTAGFTASADLLLATQMFRAGFPPSD